MIRAKTVVGCDGARSQVRAHSGVEDVRNCLPVPLAGGDRCNCTSDPRTVFALHPKEAPLIAAPDLLPLQKGQPHVGFDKPPCTHRDRESVPGVRRAKAALSSGCKPHPATAPAGSNRSSHGGNEVAEAFD